MVCHAGKERLPPIIMILPEILNQHGYLNGYLTIAVDNLIHIRAEWFARGYVHYFNSGDTLVISYGFSKKEALLFFHGERKEDIDNRISLILHLSEAGVLKFSIKAQQIRKA